MRHAERHQSPVLIAHFAELVQGARGRVVEIGCGVGSLFPHYPTTVDELVAVEPNAESRAAAATIASRLPFSARVVDNDLTGCIPVATNSVDVVVCCEVLCSVADPVRVLEEIRRILKPGGELRVYEHVLAAGWVGRMVQRVVDRAGWTWLLAGCHTARDTTRTISEAGFEWVAHRPVWYARLLITWPAGPHVIGVARSASHPVKGSST